MRGGSRRGRRRRLGRRLRLTRRCLGDFSWRLGSRRRGLGRRSRPGLRRRPGGRRRGHTRLGSRGLRCARRLWGRRRSRGTRGVAERRALLGFGRSDVDDQWLPSLGIERDERVDPEERGKQQDMQKDRADDRNGDRAACRVLRQGEFHSFRLCHAAATDLMARGGALLGPPPWSRAPRGARRHCPPGARRSRSAAAPRSSAGGRGSASAGDPGR